MKFTMWNCAMGLKKKRQHLLNLRADVMVIQECSQQDTEQFGQTAEWSSSWFGKNQNKGLGVLAKAPWVIREAQALNTKWAGKVIIEGPASIELFPVWRAWPRTGQDLPEIRNWKWGNTK